MTGTLSFKFDNEPFFHNPTHTKVAPEEAGSNVDRKLPNPYLFTSSGNWNVSFRASIIRVHTLRTLSSACPGAVPFSKNVSSHLLSARAVQACWHGACCLHNGSKLVDWTPHVLLVRDVRRGQFRSVLPLLLHMWVFALQTPVVDLLRLACPAEVARSVVCTPIL